MFPSNALAAVTDADPDAYYDALQAGPALLFDAALGLWIASRPEVVQAVLAHPACVVRPMREPVPVAIAGTSAGALFGRLMRMNEGCSHALPKAVLGRALAAIDMDHVARRSAQLAHTLAGRHPLDAAAGLNAWLRTVPTWVVADLLGFDEEQLPEVAQATADFVACLSPLSTPAALRRADLAADFLVEHFAALLERAPAGSLAQQVQDDARASGWLDQAAIHANLIGLLSQAHEASAALIANGIVAMLRTPDLVCTTVALVDQVCRQDAPVQNTRRFVTEAIEIAGVSLQAGDVILLVLGAAGRAGEVATFGHGRHACPGQQLARTIAVAALDYLLGCGAIARTGALGWHYQASLNARLPVFQSPELL